MTEPLPTKGQYDAIFGRERQNNYPAIDAFETRMGFAVARAKLEEAARVLACPVKANAPNWQHGRVLYAVARQYLADAAASERRHTFLDIGTAKGFSAICMVWAAIDAAAAVSIHSCDVIDPAERVRRNTVAEVGRFKTLAETLESWPEAHCVTFWRATGQAWLAGHDGRVGLAFVDGKHSYEAVKTEAALLAARQEPGDVILFDDVQIPGVALGVETLTGYEMEYLAAKPDRRYCVATKR